MFFTFVTGFLRTVKMNRKVISDDKLYEILPVIEQSERVALDTEADSIHCYPEKLCLIQISIPEFDILIDPLKNQNLEPLWEILKDKLIVFHAADYDIRLLYKNYRFVPSKIFDTMHGARLLGYKQVGLSDLVKKYFGVKLEKSHQKANWTTRPISPALLEYAVNDTRYLLQLADTLRNELIQKNRLGWHEETCERLIFHIVQSVDSENGEMWRLPGSSTLSPLGLSVLKEIWAWRENEALTSNKPPFFILPHNQLVLIAEAAAKSRDFTYYIPKNFSARKTSELIQAVERGLKTPPDKRPAQIRNNGEHLPAYKIAFLNKLIKFRNNIALSLKVDPSLIASRAELLGIAKNPENAQEILMNWQFELLKEAIKNTEDNS